MPLRVAPPRDAAIAGEVARDLERAVREAVGETEEPLDVRFGAWHGEDGRLLFFCKVESPPAGPFSDEEQWRWWSPLVESADELRDALRVAVARRRLSSVASSKDTPAPAEAARA